MFIHIGNGNIYIHTDVHVVYKYKAFVFILWHQEDGYNSTVEKMFVGDEFEQIVMDMRSKKGNLLLR